MVKPPVCVSLDNASSTAVPLCDLDLLSYFSYSHLGRVCLHALLSSMAWWVLKLHGETNPTCLNFKLLPQHHCHFSTYFSHLYLSIVCLVSLLWISQKSSRATWCDLKHVYYWTQSPKLLGKKAVWANFGVKNNCLFTVVAGQFLQRFWWKYVCSDSGNMYKKQQHLLLV